jgi:hypothetical protein
MMATVRLFDALPDFATQRPRLAADNHAPPARGEAPTPQPDIGAIVRNEVARAEQALAHRLTEEHEAALLAERERHDRNIAAQAQQLGDIASQMIAARFGSMEAEVVDHVTAAVARIVGGVLSEDLQRRSIETLARSVRSAIADRETIRIEVRGPQSLFEALAASLPERVGSIDYIEGSGFDLTVRVDGNLFETRLSEWSAALSEILA